MRALRIPSLVAALVLASPAAAQVAPEPDPRIFQLYSYRLTDRTRFEAGYRAHLGWHERNRDALVWYAWIVQSGPRRGQFIDGTAGATLAALDARPDLPGDAADFARTAAPHAVPVEVETWELLPAPSTATPLEDRSPGRTVDAFLLQVAPGDAHAFEQAVAALAARKDLRVRLSWYRKLRGGSAPAYMILASRGSWAEIAALGGTIDAMLARAYRADAEATQSVVARIASLQVETWAYDPRLSLIPGTPIAP